MADGDVYKVTLESRYGDTGVIVNNVLWFVQVGSEAGGVIPEQVLGAEVADSLSAGGSAGAAMRAYQTSDYVWDRVRVQRVWPGMPAGAFLTDIGVTGSAGLGATRALPSICCVVARLQSVLNTRRGRGRLYLSGWAHSTPSVFNLQNSGQWNSTLRSAVALWLTDLRATRFPALGDAGPRYIWGVWSKTVAGPSPPYNNGFSSMESTTIDSVVRAQRRREIGVGV